MTYKTYDPNELSVIIGKAPVVGFDEDSPVVIEFEDPQYKIHTDLHGEVTRFKQNRNIGKLTLNLTQLSSSNNMLSSWLELDRVKSAGVFPVIIKDNSGNTLISCTEAYIEGVPPIEFGSENKTREWVIILIKPVSFIGGAK